jgi:hypothetical protein
MILVKKIREKCILHKIDKFEFCNIEMNNYRYIFWNDEINDFWWFVSTFHELF